MPRNQHFAEIDVPILVQMYEVVTKGKSPGRCDVDGARTSAFGAAWHMQRRRPFWIVPSIVARVDRNVLIHPYRDEAGSIRVGLGTPICWDSLLFAR